MSTTPINIEASDKRVERSPPLACISPPFLARIWSANLRNHCVSATSVVVPYCPRYSLQVRKKKRGKKEKKKRKEEKKTLKWKSSFEDFEFIYSVRAVAVIRLCNLQACAIHRIALPMEEKRSREMQVDNDAGGIYRVSQS